MPKHHDSDFVDSGSTQNLMDQVLASQLQLPLVLWELVNTSHPHFPKLLSIIVRYLAFSWRVFNTGDGHYEYLMIFGLQCSCCLSGNHQWCFQWLLGQVLSHLSEWLSEFFLVFVRPYLTSSTVNQSCVFHTIKNSIAYYPPHPFIYDWLLELLVIRKDILIGIVVWQEDVDKPLWCTIGVVPWPFNWCTVIIFALGIICAYSTRTMDDQWGPFNTFCHLFLYVLYHIRIFCFCQWEKYAYTCWMPLNLCFIRKIVGSIMLVWENTFWICLFDDIVVSNCIVLTMYMYIFQTLFTWWRSIETRWVYM